MWKCDSLKPCRFQLKIGFMRKVALTNLSTLCYNLKYDPKRSVFLNLHSPTIVTVNFNLIVCLLGRGPKTVNLITNNHDLICNSSFVSVFLPDTESCTTDQSCLMDEEGDDSTSQLEGSDPGDIILRLLHLAGHSSPHRVHQ